MNNKKQITAAIVDYIEENLDKDLSLDTIAADIGYSKYYISRIFTENAGCSIHKYVRQRRLTKAASLLTQSSMPIAEIALEIHYESQQAFSQAFRKYYQESPLRYRQNMQFRPKQQRYLYEERRQLHQAVYHQEERCAA